jgi:hypothetical protein
MRIQGSRSFVSWRVRETRGSRVPVVMGVLLVIGMLLFEVWQSSEMTKYTSLVNRASTNLQQASAQLEWAKADLDRNAARSKVGELAYVSGLRPGDPGQVVWMPEDYLLEDAPAVRQDGASGGGLGRALGALVPEAMARGRRVE